MISITPPPTIACLQKWQQLLFKVFQRDQASQRRDWETGCWGPSCRGQSSRINISKSLKTIHSDLKTIKSVKLVIKWRVGCFKCLVLGAGSIIKNLLGACTHLYVALKHVGLTWT